MNVPSPVDVTELLMDWGNGNRSGLGQADATGLRRTPPSGGTSD